MHDDCGAFTSNHIHHRRLRTIEQDSVSLRTQKVAVVIKKSTKWPVNYSPTTPAGAPRVLSFPPAVVVSSQTIARRTNWDFLPHVDSNTGDNVSWVGRCCEEPPNTGGSNVSVDYTYNRQPVTRNKKKASLSVKAFFVTVYYHEAMLLHILHSTPGHCRELLVLRNLRNYGLRWSTAEPR